MKKKLQEKANELLAKARSVHEKASKEKRALTDSETAQYDGYFAELQGVRGEIARIEQLEEATRYLGEVVTQEVRDLGGNGGEQLDKDAEYRREFVAMIRGGEFNMTMLRNMNIGTAADGGYTVPIMLYNNVIKALMENTFMRKLGKVVTTASTTTIPVGGAKPTFGLIAENGAYPETDTKFAAVTLGAYKVGGIIKASEELLIDSGIDIEGYITGLIVDGIGEFEENKFISGTGASDYQGIASGTIGVTAASATAITSDEVLDMFYSVKAKYRPQSTWVVGDPFEKAVMKLKDNTGRYLWNMGLGDGVPATLNNRPIYNTAYMGAMAAGNVVASFGDMSYFMIGDRGGMNMKRLNERYADTGQIGFQVNKRGDSRITLAEAIKTFKMAAV